MEYYKQRLRKKADGLISLLSQGLFYLSLNISLCAIDIKRHLMEIGEKTFLVLLGSYSSTPRTFRDSSNRAWALFKAF